MEMMKPWAIQFIQPIDGLADGGYRSTWQLSRNFSFSIHILVLPGRNWLRSIWTLEFEEQRILIKIEREKNQMSENNIIVFHEV